MNAVYEKQRQKYWCENADEQFPLKIQGYVFWVEVEIFPHRYRQVFQYVSAFNSTFWPFPKEGNNSPVTFKEAPVVIRFNKASSNFQVRQLPVDYYWCCRHLML